MEERIKRIKFWFELRKWEREKRKEGFPKEWFEDDDTLEVLKEELIDKVDMDIELQLGKEQLGEE